jgi:hypothetical protein
MPETEEQRRMREANAIASGLFGGAAFRPVGETLSNVGRAITSAQTPAMMAGSAGVNPLTATNVPAFPSRLGPLVRTDYGLPPSERPEFRNPAEQWDARPVAARTAAATAPQPAAPSLAPAADPTFPTVGMGLMGNQNIRPLPTEQISPMTRMAPTLADRGNVSTDITGMQGKMPIQTPYGTVYATAGQAQTERVAEMGGLPAQSARLSNIGEQAQRNAAIAQMRERGAALGQQGIQRQEQFFAQKRAEREALRIAEGAARAGGVRPMDIMRAREGMGAPSTMAGIGREFGTYQPQIGPVAPTSTLVANAISSFTGGLPTGGSRPLPSGPLGPSGYALEEQQRMARGSFNPYSNVRAEQRRRTRDLAQVQGLQPAFSRGIQDEQEDYFRRRGLM